MDRLSLHHAKRSISSGAQEEDTNEKAGTREERADKDWKQESKKMEGIYETEMFNISATASSDGRKGIYRPRDPVRWRTGQVNLETNGIIGTSEKKRGTREPCFVQDLKFWDTQVNNAHVNTRGWVLRERPMAPRIIHFCEHQIAWECAEFDASESHPDGLDTFRLTSAGMRNPGRLKGLDPDRDGRDIRRSRLPEQRDPDRQTPKTFAFELWRRIVEVYSRTEVSYPSDKLIALAGISRVMSHKINGRYLAGLWENYLASQLTWRVDPTFEYLGDSPSTERVLKFAGSAPRSSAPRASPGLRSAAATACATGR
jgi:hypothetical protein